MRSLKEKEIIDMINYLLTEDYLQLTDGKYPVVKVTTKSIPVLKGQEIVMMKKSVTPVTDTREQPENADLFEVLRSLRKQISSSEGVPPFIIFADTTLKEMSRYFPIDEASMLQIKGVGRAKFDKYGQPFIDAIKNFVTNNNIEVTSVPTPTPSPLVKSEEVIDKPSHVLSYEYYRDGMTIDDIAKERKLSKITISKTYSPQR